MRPSTIGSIVGTVLTLGFLGAAGYAVYQIGYQNGLAGTATEVVVREGPHWAGGPHFFFPPFGIFFGFLFLILFFGLISRMFFWGGWRRGWNGPGRWDDESRSPMEQRLQSWHEKAHQDDRPGENRPDTT
jgi:hypothetical protein